MKRIGLALTLLLAALPALRADQVTVEVFQDQDHFLPGEALLTRVRITNRSGQTLRLGAEPDWLSFAVQTLDGHAVPKLQEVQIQGPPVLLESAKRITLNPVDLAPAFSFAETGQYQIIATLRIPGWDQEISGKSKQFHIIRGVEYWAQDFGLPLGTNAANGGNLAPETRRYVLQKADYLRSQLRLYLRVVSAAGKTIAVANVGQLISPSKPEAQVDSVSNLHILYQNGPQSYLYAMYNPDGQLLKRQTFDITNLRPRLALDLEGKIGVGGGARRVTRSDFPAPPGEADTQETSEPSGAADEAKPPKS